MHFSTRQCFPICRSVKEKKKTWLNKPSIYVIIQTSAICSVPSYDVPTCLLFVHSHMSKYEKMSTFIILSKEELAKVRETQIHRSKNASAVLYHRKRSQTSLTDKLHWRRMHLKSLQFRFGPNCVRNSQWQGQWSVTEKINGNLLFWVDSAKSWIHNFITKVNLDFKFTQLKKSNETFKTRTI